MSRILQGTLGFRVVARTLVLLGVLSTTMSPAQSEDATFDPGAALRLAGRESAGLPERLEALKHLVEGGVVPDVDRALRVAASLLPSDAPDAAKLVRMALDAGWTRPDARAAVASAAAAALGSAATPEAKSDLAAIGWMVGDRASASSLLAAWPPSALCLDALRADAPELTLVATAPPDAEALKRHVEIAHQLDLATEDDPKVSLPAMSTLRVRGAEAYPLLAATAAAGTVEGAIAGSAPGNPKRTPEGLVPRRVRAIVVLGTLGDRKATPILEDCLVDSTQSGWVRVAAVNALADLADPSAAPALCHVLFYLGDVHRLRDSWDYPGEGNTDVSADAWSDVEYYAIDSAVANALLRMGVRDAVEWALRERLDPRTGRWRIRVLQDAYDAIRRAFPDAPKGFEPDAGLPARQAAYDALLAWWKSGPKLAHPLDETDPGFAVKARALVARIGGKSVMELQNAKRAAGLIGPAMTPYVLEGLKTSTRRVQRAELAVTLGLLRDRRAQAPLLALSKDPIPAVRANALESLAAYADPVDAALLVGTTDVTVDAMVARLLEALSDTDPGARASAMKALATIGPRPDVKEGIAAHLASSHPENAFGDYVLAEQVATLLQTGEGLDAVTALLTDKDLFRRRFVWELLRVALRLDPVLFDPTPDPGTPKAKAPDTAAIRAALEKRRAK